MDNRVAADDAQHLFEISEAGETLEAPPRSDGRSPTALRPEM
jgi:hypothetical protein